MNYYLGLDNGGTLVKAVVFDQNGQMITRASEKLTMLTPAPGFTERDMDELWSANLRVLRAAVEQAGPQIATLIKSVACSGHGKGLYLWGKDQRPAYHGIVSTDARAVDYSDRFNSDGTTEKVFATNFQRILASQPVSILHWLKDHEPHVLANTQWIFECKDYIRFRLTGEAFAEITDYSGSNLLNLKERRFDHNLMETFGLGDLYDALPPLKHSTDVCGLVTPEVAAQTGLPAGIPVAGGMFDIDACAIAMDILSDDKYCVIAGTWSINGFISRQPVTDHSVMMNSIYALPDYYFIEESSPTSAGNHEWFIEQFMSEEKQLAEARGISVYRLTDDMAAAVAPEDHDIIFLPYLYGSNYNPRAKASLIGLDSSHTRAQIIRAVMEGICLGHRVHLEKLLAHKRPSVIRLAGGAANSPFWVQMFADIFQLPVETLESSELGALGCAMAASVADGHYQDLAAASHAMVRVKQRYEPQSALAGIYDRKYRRFRQFSEQLDTLWE